MSQQKSFRTLSNATYLLIACACCVGVSSNALAAKKGKRLPVKKSDIVYTATLENGKRVSCLQRKGKVFAGKAKGKKFLPTATRMKPRIASLKKKIKDATSKKAKKRLRKKLKRQQSLVTSHLQACGAKGGKGPGAPLSAECSLAPYRGPVTTEEVRYLLEKAAYGFSPADQPLVELGTSRGIGAVVSELMRTKEEVPGLYDRVLDRRDNKIDNEDDPLRGGDRRLEFSGMRAALLDLHVNTSNPYREKLSTFLLSIWTAGEQVLTNSNQRQLMWDYIELLRRYAYNPDMIQLGTEVTVSPLMLLYLNGDQNIALAPNENYGRELLELFVMGPEDLNGRANYTEDGDIVEISKALTGWTVIEKEVPDPFDASETVKVWRAVSSPADHAQGLKTLFAGKPYEAQVDDYRDVLPAVFGHPSAAPYYARQIVEEYVTRDAPRCLIERLAIEIEDANFNLDEPMRKLLGSEAFFAEGHRDSVAKNSLEYTVELIRTLGIPYDHSEIRKMLDGELNQAITRAPSVFWWDPNTWSSGPVTLAKANLITKLIRNKRAQLGDDETEADDWLPERICPTDALADEGDLIDAVMSRMGVTIPTDDIRQQLLFYGSNRKNSDGTFDNSRYDTREESSQRRKCFGMYFIAALTPDFMHK